jgi:hypothetical protein
MQMVCAIHAEHARIGTSPGPKRQKHDVKEKEAKISVQNLAWESGMLPCRACLQTSPACAAPFVRLFSATTCNMSAEPTILFTSESVSEGHPGMFLWLLSWNAYFETLFVFRQAL